MTKKQSSTRYDPVAAALAQRREDPAPPLTLGSGVTLASGGIEGGSGATTLREGEEVLYVEISRLKPNPFQPRRAMAELPLFELMFSIKKNGFNDVLPVRQDPEYPNNYQLAAGHRRKEALGRLISGDFTATSDLPALADLRTPLQEMHNADPSIKYLVNDRIPVVVRAYSNREMMDNAWHENARREPLTPPEEGRLFLLRRETDHLTQEDLARELGVEVTYIKRREAAARDPEDIQAVWAKPDSMRAVTYLRQLVSTQDRTLIIQLYLEGRLTTDQVRDAVQAVKDAGTVKTQALGQGATEEGAREHLDAPGSPGKEDAALAVKEAPAAVLRRESGEGAATSRVNGFTPTTLQSTVKEASTATLPRARMPGAVVLPDGDGDHQATQEDRERRVRQTKLSTALRTLIAYHKDLISSGATPSAEEIKTWSSIEKIVDDIKRAHTPA